MNSIVVNTMKCSVTSNQYYQYYNVKCCFDWFPKNSTIIKNYLYRIRKFNPTFINNNKNIAVMLFLISIKNILKLFFK